LQHRLDQRVGHLGELQRGVGVGAQGEKNHREGFGFDLGDDRLVNALGQALAHPGDLVAHVGSGGIGIAGQGKTHADLAALLAAGGGDHVHTLDARERVFQHLADLGFHDLAGSASKGGGHRHHGFVDLGVLTHRQTVEGDRANQHDQQGQHGGKDRAADGGFSQLHDQCPGTSATGGRGWRGNRSRFARGLAERHDAHR